MRTFITVVAAVAIAGCATGPSAPPMAPDRGVPTVAPSGVPTMEPTEGGSPSPAPRAPTAPGHVVELPDGLDDVTWAHVARAQVGDDWRSTVTAGRLGGPASLTIPPRPSPVVLDVATSGDLVALLGDPASEIWSLSEGALVGTVPSSNLVALDARLGLVYWGEHRGVGVGVNVHRSRLDGSEDVVLIELGPEHAQDGMPNGMEVWDGALAPDGTFVGLVCTAADGCELRVAGPEETDVARTPVTGPASLCSVMGVVSDLLVVHDAEACFADYDRAPTPVSVVDLRTGERRLLHDGPWFGGVRLQERNGVPEVLVHRPHVNGRGDTVQLVDLRSGERDMLLEALPTVVVDGQTIRLVPSRLDLPPDWLLLVPEPLVADIGQPAPSVMPPSQLVNIRDNRWIELPSVPGMAGTHLEL